MQEVEYSQAFVDKAAHLSYQEVSAVFHLPLHEACVQLRVDEASLKKRCRQLNISRYVYEFFSHSCLGGPIENDVPSSKKLMWVLQIK
jgi:hypothetical protein